MAAPRPTEFRQRAIELARSKVKPIALLAKDLQVSESCPRNWVAQADRDEDRREGLISGERKGTGRLRREERRLEMEVLRRAAAYFARENVLPK